jgi:hypothetical protein
MKLLNPEQVSRALAVCCIAGVPANLVGPPGIGKTSAVKLFLKRVNAKDPNYKMWNWILSTKSAGDIAVPAPVNGRLDYLFPPDLPVGPGFENAEGILFFDEIDRTTDEDLRNAVMQFLLDGNFHGHKLSSQIFVVSAMNGTTDEGTQELTSAARTRLCHLYMSCKAPGYWQSWKSWAEDEGLNESVIKFTMETNGKLEGEEKAMSELAEDNPRTRGMVSKIVQACESVSFKTSDIKQALIEGVIGETAATAFLMYLKKSESIVSAEEIFTSTGDSARIPSNVGDIQITIMLANDAATTHLRRKVLARYIKRCPKEVLSSLLACNKLSEELVELLT